MIDELLKALKEKAQELSNEHWGDDERHLIGKGIQCMYVQAENIIRSKLNGGWIPCSERLPEKSNSYLVTKHIDETENNMAMSEVCTEIFWITDNKWDCERDSDCEWKVTAWRPLPEAYHG